MRYGHVLDEYGEELVYSKDESNVVADALSRLEIDDEIEVNNLSKAFGFDDNTEGVADMAVRLRRAPVTRMPFLTVADACRLSIVCRSHNRWLVLADLFSDD